MQKEGTQASGERSLLVSWARVESR